MPRTRSRSRPSRVAVWLCLLAAGLVLVPPAPASPAPVPNRDAPLSADTVGFWLKVASLGLQLLANIITALEEIEKVQEANPPNPPPRADGPPWQPTENPAPRVLHTDF